MTPLLVALLLSSNASGKTLVRTNQGTTVPISRMSGPLIPDDANTVAHVTWNGTALVDAVSANSWTMNGTVPQVQRSGKKPTGAGPFTDSNFYALGTGSDVLDFTGDFSACFVAEGISNPASQPALFDNGSFAGSVGYTLDVSNANAWRLTIKQTLVSTVSPSTSDPNAVCIGRSGTTWMIKANLGTIATSTIATYAAATTVAATLGRNALNATRPWGVPAYEAWFSTTTASDALFTMIQQRVKSRLGVTSW